jgi:hypothetical protein
MFGNKERRDIALLIFMALVVIGFLAYLFLPSGKKSVPETLTSAQMLPEKMVNDKSRNPMAEDVFVAYNSRLEAALASFFQQLDDLELLPHQPAPDVEAALYDSHHLEKGGGRGRQLLDILEKIKRLSVLNLKELLLLEYPNGFSRQYRFNVYSAALLAKVAAENITWHISTASNMEVRKFIDFSVYNLIGNELEKDYQTLPALVYLELSLKRLNIYTDPGQVSFFKDGIDKLRDLTPQKLFLQVVDYLSYAEERSLFRLEWRENDDLDPDDVGVYQKMDLPCVHFLKQKYLVFPASREEDNLWISELCKADSGDIELGHLSISSEDPAKSIRLDRILYTPETSRFICVLGDTAPQSEPMTNGNSRNLLPRRISSLIKSVEKNYRVIDFTNTNDEKAQKERRRQLKEFGVYLKSVIF